MISSSDTCKQLVAGNYDVMLNEPIAFKQVLTDFLDRCELYENQLLVQHQEQEQQQQEQQHHHQQQQPLGSTAPGQPDEKQSKTRDETGEPTNNTLVHGRGYVNEFFMLKELSKVLKKDTSNYSDGLEPYNRLKNRYGDIIPFNHTRVILSCNPLLDQCQRNSLVPGGRTHNERHRLHDPQPRHDLQLPHELPLDGGHMRVAYELGSDYINANYIRGPSGSPRSYIASQGPLPGTLNDFWRMIWECNVSVIVMACNELELGRSKCELYWPEQLESSQVFGNIQVTLMRVRQVNSDFLIRKFSVKYLEPECAPSCTVESSSVDTNGGQNGSVRRVTSTIATTDERHPGAGACAEHSLRDTNSTTSSESISASDDSMATSSTNATTSTATATATRSNHDRASTAAALRAPRRVLMEKSVVQFHISSWPDHGVPDSVQPILELVRLVREVQPFEHSPILVHCSAGCGRTGTICCIDYVYGLMRMGKLDASFDLFTIIRDMRKQRMAMVQTLEQYILCHRAVASLFMQQLQLLGHSCFQRDARERERELERDAKRASARSTASGAECARELALGAPSEGGLRNEAGAMAACEQGDQLDTSNETSGDSYTLYCQQARHHHHDTSSSADEQHTNSDFQEDEDEEEEDEDLGPVFI